MSTPAISVRNLSKRYKLGTINRHTLVDECAYWWHKLRGKDPEQHFSKIGHSATDARRIDAERQESKDFWALQDVTFEIQPGEVVGIIGRNGAGKSTLLKILSRITEPTVGEARIEGRVGSLLEVGTGFHPELTGRENIYMNGTILGMRKREITAKFDEIVAFSELEQFVDTPVKRYSSGMYVRLAFAVAAHLEPEILLVDEVLAVGDAAFQKKCLGKMGDVAKEGRTILLVSHQMPAIRNLCGRVLLVGDGRIQADGETGAVVRQYLDAFLPSQSEAITLRRDRKGNGFIRFSQVRLRDEDGRIVNGFASGDTGMLELVFERLTTDVARNVRFGVGIDDAQGQRLAFLGNEYTSGLISALPAKADRVEVRFRHLPLAAGRYSLSLFVEVNGIVADWILNAVWLHVEAGDFYGTGKLPSSEHGQLLVNHKVAVP